MTHTLAITTRYDDGHESRWHYYNQPGTAQDAHDALAKRWTTAGYEFQRDRATCILTRHYADEERGGPYTDVITHEDDGSEP